MRGVILSTYALINNINVIFVTVSYPSNIIGQQSY
jgi:hypothetical protein